MTKIQRFVLRRMARLAGIALLAPAGVFNAVLAAIVAAILTLEMRLQRLMGQRVVRLASIALLAPMAALSLAPVATFAAVPDSRGLTESAAAQMHASLTYSADAALAPGAAFTYKLTVTNDGPGVALSTWAALPLDPNVAVDDFASGNPTIFVTYLGADAIHIQLDKMDPGDVATVEIYAHVLATAPQALTIDSRATINWNDVHADMNTVSNALPVVVGAGAPAPVQAQTLQIAADGPVDAGTLLAVQGAFYGGKEAVSFWINTPAGTVLPATSLGQTDSALQGSVVPLDALGYTDAQGNLMFTLDTTGLPSGTYSLVAHGWASGVEGVASFTIN